MNWFKDHIVFVGVILFFASAVYVFCAFALLPFIRQRRDIRACIRRSRDADKERTKKVIRLKAVEKKLDALISPVKNGTKVQKVVMYSNMETGTLVYRVVTSNASETNDDPLCWTLWDYFLLGDTSGYAVSIEYIDSDVVLGKIIEDSEYITIERSGMATTCPGGEPFQVGNLNFGKRSFLYYPNETTSSRY
jgi:hypothetical protein